MFGSDFEFSMLIAEALRESKREMTNATRGTFIIIIIFIFTFNYKKRNWHNEESSSSSLQFVCFVYL
jgi:hypothetical protein